MPKTPSHPIADQFSDEEMEQMKRHGQALNEGTGFDDEVEASLNRKYAKEASAKKMHAAQTSGGDIGLGPSDMDTAAIKSRDAAQQQTAAQGQQAAMQAQAQQTQPAPPAAPTGPTGVSAPYPAQRAPQPPPSAAQGLPGPGEEAPPAPGGPPSEDGVLKMQGGGLVPDPDEVSSPPGGIGSQNLDALSQIMMGRAQPVNPPGPTLAPRASLASAPRPTPVITPTTSETRADIDGDAAASIRYNNPGAMWPGNSSRKFGASTYGVIKEGNRIANFQSPEAGAAAQFDLLNSKPYLNKPIQDVIKQWSGGTGGAKNVQDYIKSLGVAPDAVVTKELLQSPAGIALAKKQAAWEAGQEYPMTDEQWKTAQQMAFGNQ